MSKTLDHRRQDAALKLKPLATSLARRRGWEISSTLGAGRSSVVFAVKTKDGPRALKIYNPKYIKAARTENRTAQFNRTLAELTDHDCPSIVPLYSGGDFQDTFFVLMGIVEGEPLADQLGSVPREAIRPIIRQIARAGHYLVERGVPNFDINSLNIMVSDNYQRAVLIDVGYPGANARFAAPEEMFNLGVRDGQKPKAIALYQIGTVLHDLIMRRLLFTDRVPIESTEHKAMMFTVAADIPKIVNDGTISDGLVELAQSALEKRAEPRLRLVDWMDFLG